MREVSMAAKKNLGAHSDHQADLMGLESLAWDRMAPVGREFGSPEYDRLAELDNLATQAHGSLLAARRWLDAPNPMLDHQAPEDVARTPEGYARVIQLLNSLGGAA